MGLHREYFEHEGRFWSVSKNRAEAFFALARETGALPDMKEWGKWGLKPLQFPPKGGAVPRLFGERQDG